MTPLHMTLTDEQKTAVAAWIEAGAGISDVQKRLLEDFQISLTYMDTRFLVDDLKLALKELEEPEPPVTKSPLSEEESLPVDEILPPAGGTGSVRVTIDQITRPSALISGQAVFSDGQSAEWYLDQMGRLGLNPTTPGYRPSEADVIAFQTELQRLASAQGF